MSRYPAHFSAHFRARCTLKCVSLTCLSQADTPGDIVGTMSQLFTIVVTYGAHDRANSSVMHAGHAMATHDAVAKVGDMSRNLHSL